MNSLHPSRRRLQGFTLIEALLVIAILGVLAALAVAAYSNASMDTRRVIARQQQAEVQNAVSAWLSSYTARSTKSLKDARDVYTAAGTDLAKFQLIDDYLDKSTRDHFLANSGPDVQSAAMKALGVKLEFPTWDATNSPEVDLN